MDGFQRRKERKKESIQSAALALFKKYGIKKISVAEIAKEANVSQVTIYNYFGSKDDLVHAVIIYYIDEVWQDYEQLLESDLSFHEKIRQVIFKEGELAGQISETFFGEFMKHYSEAEKYIDDHFQNKILPKLIRFFDEGKEQGYINPDISNEAILFYSQMFIEAMQREDVYTKVLPMAEDIVTLFFYGIFGKNKE
ncbi:TetR/AcrR family transcriptional regulator [Virgibacillus doumboii]|uniref:TetR/AcrR family transcriptional regulator n=1 Tax=Virgibacillus doumboii TaxID=2697503 RepID=UPI0013DF18D4|nr:TetR/AcrR family transcriptional regulator [Virgibacillus doumboii]